MKSATECPAGCVWSNGAEMIPVGKHYCAPEDMSADYSVIKRCAYGVDEATCNNGCKWRAGLTIA
jgi:hypothetical protein